MGFKISWLAVEAVTKANLLEQLGFRDAGIDDEANEFPFSAAQLPTGWSIIWSNDFEWAATHPLISGPPAHRTVSCQIHEGVMYSAAHGTRDGAEIWSISHDSSSGINDLQTSGELPEAFSAIKARLLKEQEDAGGIASEVDYIFDVPVDLAFELTGFRYDLWDLSSGPRPRFTSVELKK